MSHTMKAPFDTPLAVPPPVIPYATYQPSPSLQPDPSTSKVRDIRPGMKSFNLEVTVLGTHVTETGMSAKNVHSYWVADDTGSVIWTALDPGFPLEVGDMVRLIGVEATLWKGSVQIRLSPRAGGRVERYSSLLQVFDKQPNLSHITWIPDDGSPDGWTMKMPESGAKLPWHAIVQNLSAGQAPNSPAQFAHHHRPGTIKRASPTPGLLPSIRPPDKRQRTR
ncbi:hypothetical protein BC832DRAFT_589749 [Gaertneriomyces semiglobifer]|nr:hypothetical protein BC832DRAFT_589749 [Gaertneriomyces semiglobifer]